jgi:FAD/FMN-containing dehydrogenase/Fe-S oxidoreductase
VKPSPAGGQGRRGGTPERVDAGGLEAELRKEADAEVRFDAGSRALYATDASNYRQVPIGVVIPRSREAVEAALAVCRKYDAPVLPRGGGTALCGQTCNVAVVFDFSKYLNRVLELDPEHRLARVEPGTILDDLRDAAEAHHLTFGPDPSTHSQNSLGGMIGNNSCGIHSIMSGRTVDNVHELEVLTYDGLRLRVGATSEPELERIIGEGGRRGELYAGLRGLRDRCGGLVRERYPQIPRRVSGYCLDELLPEQGFHVARALVGTEGTCALTLEATLRLVPSPPGRAILMLGYPDVFSAADHVPEILRFEPVGLEGLDDLLVQFMKKKGLHVEDLGLLPEGGGWLLVEFGGADPAEAEANARRAMNALKKARSRPSMELYADPGRQKRIWEIRKSGLGATANVPGEPFTWPGWEDAGIAPEKLGTYLREFRTLLEEFGYRASVYGHFGDGCIHCRIPFDLFTQEGIRKWMAFLDRASDLVLKYGGSFSAEHGDGQAKAIFLPKMYGEELVDAFREFNALWDPRGKMNPGKVLGPLRPDENLRLGAEYRPWQPETHYRFPKDNGSFPRATLRCVGVGKCRRMGDVFMCPSFLATREEAHSTRGRAHLLFEMFRGDFLREKWKSKEVLAALDLCLACKGCKSECPVDVDMATYKSEFLAHHYRHRLRPLSHYLLGLLPYAADVGARYPRLVNFFSQTPPFRDWVRRAGGLSPERPLPAFAREPFLAWFGRRRQRRRTGEPVVLFPDLYNDCFTPRVAQAATRLLERWGFRVEVPHARPREGLPLLHFGFLGLGKREMRRAMELLRDFGSAGVPIVFLEPTTAGIFRDQLLELFPEDLDVQRISKLSVTLSEFIEERGLGVPELTGKAILHGHCHEKALLSFEAASRVLERTGLAVQEPEPGCCGMAGSFGYEEPHYAVSVQLAARNLLPAVRRAEPATYVVADGFSCRTQIREGTGREPLHLAELLEGAWKHSKPTAPS